MSIIYEPKGKAFEYSALAANLYRGCSHGCTYCYAPNATRVDRNLFYSKSFIKPRIEVVQQLQKDVVKFSGDDRKVLLCFTSDPYQPIEKQHEITKKALCLFSLNKIKPQILTKAGAWAVNRDLDLLKASGAIWAATLTTDSDNESLQWEPGAALPGDRIEALQIAKNAGLRTWVSFEPVFNPDAVYRLIDETCNFVDLYKIGKMNYHPIANEIDWHGFLIAVKHKLDSLGKNYYIKKDLLAFQ